MSGKKNPFIMKRQRRKSNNRPESRKDLIISLLLNETRLSYVCASHPRFEQTDIISKDCIAFDGKKPKHIFSIVIALLSSTTVCLC